MVRLAILAFCLLAGSAPATDLRAAAAAPASLRLIDLTDEFDAFWERTAGEQPAQRAARFRADMAPLLPGFYEARRAGVDQERYDRHIADALDAYPRQRDGVRAVSRRFAEMLAPARLSFEAAFGAFAAPQPVYLVHSLGEMDGGTRPLPGGITLVFGADMIARLHLAHDIRPFFHHELFHILHIPRFGRCVRLWCRLWIEGLATHVAKSLNPAASDAELLLEIPGPIRPAVDANRHEAVCAVRARFDSADAGDMGALFGFSRLNERLPPRFAYYVGYLAAAELGRTRSLRRLAAMSPDEVRPLLLNALRGLAACPQPLQGGGR